ncbi:MAG TPA: Hpt domain-containing protein [Candidatus Limnocylindrales bacterium]|nr:Hpt domain-containing protein [Candidatus Limnocylindrales bacterium]
MTDNPITSDVFERLRQATASRPAELVELCRDYLTEARQTLAQLRNAFTLKQANELRNRAHYLKGSSMVMGAIVVTQCCASLEAMGRNGDFGEAGRMLDQLSTALDAVEQEYVNRLGPDVLPAKGPAA